MALITEQHKPNLIILMMKTRIFLMAALFIFSFISCKNATQESSGKTESAEEIKEHRGQASFNDGESDANDFVTIVLQTALKSAFTIFFRKGFGATEKSLQQTGSAGLWKRTFIW